MSYHHNDPYEREPLGTHHASPARMPAANYDYPQSNAPSPYRDASPAAYNPYQPPSTESFSRPLRQDSPSRSASSHGQAPPPPRHLDYSYYNRGSSPHADDRGYPQQYPNNITPGADNFSEHASGGITGIAYTVADHNARESGVEAMHGIQQVPPPPSRNHGNVANYSGGGGYMYESQSHALATNPSPMHSHPSSVRSFGRSDPYADDPYQGYSSSTRSGDRRLGEVNPNEIEDDGDDGLHYHPKHSQRNSVLSSAANSERGRVPAMGAATTGALGAGMLSKKREGGITELHLSDGPDHPSDWMEKQKGNGKKWRWVVIIVAFLIIAGAIVGGVVGGMLAGRRDGGKSKGESAEDDSNKNGDLDINSAEIKQLMNNPDFHRVFLGMDYTPIHSQYPDCMHNPPSQNNVTRDMAVLSQLTNKVRLYGTDCNQTQMVLHAIDKLNLKGDVKVWMGVWQDKNETTNDRQLSQMWQVLDEYGDEPFEGLIVANEILFREEMTISTLGSLLESVRSNLTERGLNLPVATSDLGDDWTQPLADASDYLMANIHPFFAGTPADNAAAWTMNFWENSDGPFFKADKSKNIISETGWPTGGGTNCGSAGVTDCPNGSVAGVDELNTFMQDWICPALENGTNYFWFSAFDEPWKISFNEKGREWEDKWGLMDVNRNLKKGVTIPDCGGKTVS